MTTEKEKNSKQKEPRIDISKHRFYDLLDIERCATAAFTMIRCPGGRMIAEGFLCFHCRSDLKAGDKCKQPKHKQDGE